jgi:hypothetical protein
MTIDARIRLSLSTGELELEGSEAFIKEYAEDIGALLKRLSDAAVTSPAVTPAEPARAEAVRPADRTSDRTLPEFGEVLHQLPNGITGTEEILVAGYYASRQTADKTFPTADANKLLIEQGIKLANPSQSLKNNMDSRRVFKTGKNYKLSRDGVRHVSDLIGISGLEP